MKQNVRNNTELQKGCSEIHVKKRRTYIFNDGYTTPCNGIPFGEGGNTKIEIQTLREGGGVKAI